MPEASRSDLPLQSSEKLSNLNCPLEYSQTFEANEFTHKLVVAGINQESQDHLQMIIEQNQYEIANI